MKKTLLVFALICLLVGCQVEAGSTVISETTSESNTGTPVLVKAEDAVEVDETFENETEEESKTEEATETEEESETEEATETEEVS